jgi:D-serine deaminase-like pyridoxal phosphate-dependent protein
VFELLEVNQLEGLPKVNLEGFVVKQAEGVATAHEVEGFEEEEGNPVELSFEIDVVVERASGRVKQAEAREVSRAEGFEGEGVEGFGTNHEGFGLTVIGLGEDRRCAELDSQSLDLDWKHASYASQD